MIRLPAISERTKAALYRLERALDQENEALAAFDSGNLSEYSRIKNSEPFGVTKIGHSPESRGCSS